MSLRRITFAAYLAFLAGSFFGVGEEIEFLDQWAAKFDSWLFDTMIAFPIIFVGAVGLGLGFYVIPTAWEFISKRRNFAAQYDIWRNEKMGQDKTKLFSYLGRAYNRWREANPELPGDIQLFIDQAEYPEWIPIRHGNLSEAATENVIWMEEHWEFFKQFYDEVASVLGSHDRALLLINEEEARDFHDVRQRINYFWEEIGRHVFLKRSLRYKDIEEWLETDHRVIKVLPYLAISLHVINRQKGKKGQYMFQLGAKYFGTLPPNKIDRIKMLMRRKIGVL